MKKFFLMCLSVVFFFSCSSAPKRLMYVSDVSNLSYSYLEKANSYLIQENFGKTCMYLSDAYKLALSVDNTELLCKIALSSLAFKIVCPYLDEIIIASSLENDRNILFLENEEILSQAKKFASRSELKDSLSEICSIYEVRLELENQVSENGKISDSYKNKYFSILEKAKKNISKEPYYLAYLYRTMGDVCLSSESYIEAVSYFQEAVKIHTKERYLLEIALDWYSLSRVWSLSGNKEKALSAIQTALKYDKDAENTKGIVSDYMAYSKILLKGNPTEEDVKLSEELALWAEKIRDSGE